MFLFEGDLVFVWVFFVDEWDLIVLGYILGIILSFKGVFFFYRGVYVVVLSNFFVWEVFIGVVYLWIFFLFYCNGWCYFWGIVVYVGMNVCFCYVIVIGIYNVI